MNCTSCLRIWDTPPGGGPAQRRVRPAIARWTHPNTRAVDYVCQSTLDYWFDNADEDPFMEPTDVRWLDGTRHLT